MGINYSFTSRSFVVQIIWAETDNIFSNKMLFFHGQYYEDEKDPLNLGMGT